MVCRHVFFICICENIRDIQKLQISRRWLSLNHLISSHFSVLPDIEPKQLTENHNDEGIKIDLFEEKKIEQTETNNHENNKEPQKEEEITNMKKVVNKKGAPKKGTKYFFYNPYS